MTDRNRWNLLEEIFEHALSLDPAERTAYLAGACGDDEALRNEIDAMLAADAAGAPLEEAVARAAESLVGIREVAMEGRRIGAYRVVREIGRGGMGRVFLAERDDDQYTSRVALKLLGVSGSRESLEQRFRTERQALADLDHPGIARLLDAGITPEGESYLVMEYVDGEPIDAYCERNRLTVQERVALVGRLCEAVQHAHQNLVVHRDIKASNVLVTRDGEPKLLDFGIAKLIDPERVQALHLHRTGDATRVLTPATASPEQLRGESVTMATDVYAIGHLLYHLLTGRTPYPAAATDPFALPAAILNDEPLRPSLAVRRAVGWRREAPGPEAIAATLRSTPEALARRLSGDLDTIILKALRKEPPRRYTTPAQLGEDLQRHLDHRPVLARADSPGYVAQRFVRRYRRPVAAAGAGVVLLVALIAFYTARLADERDRAQVEARRAEEVAAFLTQLFEVSTPEESRGVEITARELLDRGADRIEAELRDEPVVQASLMNVIGSAYGSLGLYEPATQMLQRAIAVRERVPDQTDRVLGDALNQLGEVLLAQARYDEADSLLHRALDLRRTVLGAPHRDVASTLRSLAMVAHERADFDATDRYLGEAETMVLSLTPPDSTALADVLLARGNLYHRLGKSDSAVATYRRVIEIRTRVSGSDHPVTMAAQSNLSDALISAGHLAEAEAVQRALLEVRRRVMPVGHPDLGYTLTNLATALKMQGRPAEAMPFQREAHEIFRGVHSGDHSAIIMSLNNLANLHHDLRELDEAYALHQEGLAMARRLHGDDHPALADSYSNLAALQLDREDYAGALEMYGRTLELDRRTLGEDHPYVAHDRIAIGVVLGLLGRTAEAEDTLRQALAQTERLLGEEHPQRANAMRELASVLRLQDRHGEAAELLQESLPIFERAYSGDPWETALARAHLGDSYARLARPTEAEPLLRIGYARLRELRGANDRMTRQARGFLYDFLRDSGRREEADALLESPSPGGR